MTATLARRLANLEAMLRHLPATGCGRCAGWGEQVVEYAADDRDPGLPWVAREAEERARRRAEGTYWPEDYRCPGCGREPEYVVTIGYDTEGTVWTRPTPLPAAEPEAESAPHVPAEQTTAEVLAEVHAAIAALAAERPAAEPEPESESGEDAPQDARPLPRWGPTHRRTTPRPAPPSRYRWR